MCKAKGQSKSVLPAMSQKRVTKKVTKGLQIVGWNEMNITFLNRQTLLLDTLVYILGIEERKSML